MYLSPFRIILITTKEPGASIRSRSHARLTRSQTTDEFVPNIAVRIYHPVTNVLTMSVMNHLVFRQMKSLTQIQKCSIIQPWGIYGDERGINGCTWFLNPDIFTNTMLDISCTVTATEPQEDLRCAVVHHVYMCTCRVALTFSWNLIGVVIII